MSHSQPTATWCRAGDLAFVDDGQRVLVLRLVDPATARPLLLEGALATAWRMLQKPTTSPELAEELTRRQPADREATVKDVSTLLDVLLAASLVQATHP